MSAQVQPQQGRWPVKSGVLPDLAGEYTRRSETGHGPWDALHAGLTVIVGPDGDRGRSVTWPGGTGKTRMAAEFAARLWAANQLDLLVWIDAAGRDSIVSGYTRALADIKVAAPAGKPEAAASLFLTWLADTGRRWLVVLDGIVEPTDADGLWPQGPAGQTIVTTSLIDLKPSPSTGHATTADAAPVQDPVSIGMPAFSPREALEFLSDRLGDDPYRSGGALDLALVLECMPTALTLAVAYLHDAWQDCRQYRLALDRYRRDTPDGGRGDPCAASWKLAMERATQFAPPDLSWPALRLTAVLGPTWIPGSVLLSAAACAYVTGRHDVTRADQESVRAAFGNLERVGLVTIQPGDEIRTVRMSAALQWSICQAIGPAEVRRAVRAAADAICESWPGGEFPTELEQSLRDCATGLRRCDDHALWTPDAHPMLVLIGENLDRSGMTETALSYWRDLAGRCAGYVGAGSALTFQVRGWLASAAMAAGHIDEAISLREQLAADIEQLAGSAHPESISSRASLASALRQGGRPTDAILLGNQVVSDSDRVFGSAHAQTTAILCELGRAYRDAGQYPQAISAFERCLALRTQSLGLMHPETLADRHRLADTYRRAARAKDAITLYQDAVAQLGGPAGARSAEAATALEHLAIAYYDAGLTNEAVSTLERALTEGRRVPGGDAAATLHARANLAAICCRAGRLKQAIRLYEGAMEDLERFHGAAHPESFRARWNLAAAYHKAKRLPEAVTLGEATLNGCEGILGPGHRETLTSRANLAHAYHATGQLKRASAQFDRALRDCERALDPADPLMREVRDLRARYLSGRQGAAPILSSPEL